MPIHVHGDLVCLCVANLSTDCATASSMFENKVDKYRSRAGYT